MHNYKTRKKLFQIGKFSGKIRLLKDINQFHDPQGEAEKAGICSTSWSLFGQLWPASKVLAQAMKQHQLKDSKILELGCGLGLPSMILKYRRANITASDYHPASRDFLNHNTKLNNLPDIPFIQLDWNEPPTDHSYDLIIASDVLYDPGNPKLLSGAINKLASANCKIILSCPGRGYKNLFNRKMASYGFKPSETPVAFSLDEKPPFKGRLLAYYRA